MGGDFNRNINLEIKVDSESNSNSNSKLVFELNHSIFNFNSTNKVSSNTCCSISGNNLKKNFDFIIDSLDSIVLRHELNKESWYKLPSSDHIMIMTIIKKYI
jgi:hypothetical protein